MKKAGRALYARILLAQAAALLALWLLQAVYG